MEYLAVSTMLSFTACKTQSCVNIPIVDDALDEPERIFYVSLERTPDLNDRITLDPVDGEITLIDDDGMFPTKILSLYTSLITEYCTIQGLDLIPI